MSTSLDEPVEVSNAERLPDGVSSVHAAPAAEWAEPDVIGVLE